MTVRVGVNGFGRIGRNFFRALDAQKALGNNTDIEIIAVNDLTSNATLAHLLKFDSILGRLPYEVSLEGDDTIVVGDTKIKALEVKAGPAELPWGDLGVDVVVESTGIFTNAAKAKGTWTQEPRRSSSPPRPPIRTSPSCSASTTTSTTVARTSSPTPRAPRIALGRLPRSSTTSSASSGV